MNKLSFLVKKISKEVSSDSVDAVTALLCERYIEYQKRPISEVKEGVHAALLEDSNNSSILNNSAVLHENSNSNMSMNRSLTSTYQKGGLIVKVVRTQEENVSAPIEDVGIQVDSKPSAASKKRKLVNKVSDRAEGQEESTTPALKYFVARPLTRLYHIAGLETIVEQIKEMIFYPVLYSGLYFHLKVQSPSGLLLLGPSGIGKTFLASAIAGETGLPFFKVTGPELIGGTSGESEQNIRQLFASAKSHAPSIIFIDSLDAIAGIRESSQRGMDRRIIAQFFDCMDDLMTGTGTGTSEHEHSSGINTGGSGDDITTSTTATNATSAATTPELTTVTGASRVVLVIAATNKADSLDPGLRGRFAREISLPVPDAHARAAILGKLAGSMKLADDIDFDLLGKATPGFVGAANGATISDEEAMGEISSVLADKNVSLEAITELVGADILQIIMSDFTAAVKHIQPTAKREGFAVVPDVTWNDIGALTEVRDELLHNFLKPIANPERFRRLGLEVPAGVIFYGPPGCGKTLLAKALANQSGANFISVKGPELLNMYVGESESKVRQVFARARASTPCMIFFDELDALVPKRGASEGGSGVSERVVNQFLTELDGLEARRDVYVVAATNRLELIDEAMLRPGRLGKLLYVPLPVKDERHLILQALTRNVSLDRTAHGGVDLEAVANDARMEGFSGADIAALVREAAMSVVREWKDGDGDGDLVASLICARHFEAAFAKVKPSVSQQDRAKYERVNNFICKGMGAVEALRAAASASKQ